MQEQNKQKRQCIICTPCGFSHWSELSPALWLAAGPQRAVAPRYLIIFPLFTTFVLLQGLASISLLHGPVTLLNQSAECVSVCASYTWFCQGQGLMSWWGASGVLLGAGCKCYYHVLTVSNKNRWGKHILVNAITVSNKQRIYFVNIWVVSKLLNYCHSSQRPDPVRSTGTEACGRTHEH